jgi:hypothetical protein
MGEKLTNLCQNKGYEVRPAGGLDSPYRCLSNDAVRRTIRVSATKLLALKMAMHLAGEAWS